MNLLETFVEKESFVKHSPKDILLFALVVISALNLYLYFRFLDSGGKTEVVINTGYEAGEVAGVKSQDEVYISGAVNFPGVYSAESGSLVRDILKMAGGFSSTANVMWISKNLNLSEKIEPNSSIYIPFGWDTEYILATTIEVVTAPSDGAGADEDDSQNDDNSGQNDNDKINVNTATLEGLDGLDGIGPAYAQKIIDNRPYEDFEEFKSKSTLSENLVNSLSEYVTFN